MEKRNIIILLLILTKKITTNTTDFTTDVEIRSTLSTNSPNIHKTVETKSLLELNSKNGKTEIENNGETLTIKTNRIPSIEISPITLKSKEGSKFPEGVNINKDLVVNKRRQWMLAHTLNLDFFEKRFIQKCGIFKIVGGHCVSSDEDLKYNLDLPPHDFVRITLNYHFIDNWQGETGYVKVRKIFFSFLI